MAKHHTSVRETVSMGVIMVTAKIFLTFPRVLAERATHAGWLVVLIAAASSSLAWWPVQGLMRLFPERSLADMTDAALGSVVGKACNLVYLATFLGVTTISLQQFAENIVSSILPKTPLPAVLLPFLATATYLAYLGLEAIARIAVMYGVFMAAGLGVMLGGGLLTSATPMALVPFWGPGPSNVLAQGLSNNSIFLELLVFGLLVPMLRKPKQVRAAFWWTHALSTVIIAGTMVTYLYVFAYPTAARINFPLLEVSRMIIAGRWFQRVESVFLIIWVFAAAIALALGLFAAGHLLAHVMGLRDYRPLLFPLAVIIYDVALLPSNLSEAVAWDTDGPRFVGWVPLLLLPWLTWVIALIRNRGKRHAAG